MLLFKRPTSEGVETTKQSIVGAPTQRWWMYRSVFGSKWEKSPYVEHRGMSLLVTGTKPEVLMWTQARYIPVVLWCGFLPGRKKVVMAKRGPNGYRISRFSRRWLVLEEVPCVASKSRHSNTRHTQGSAGRLSNPDCKYCNEPSSTWKYHTRRYSLLFLHFPIAAWVDEMPTTLHSTQIHQSYRDHQVSIVTICSVVLQLEWEHISFFPNLLELVYVFSVYSSELPRRLQSFSFHSLILQSLSRFISPCKSFKSNPSHTFPVQTVVAVLKKLAKTAWNVIWIINAFRMTIQAVETWLRFASILFTTCIGKEWQKGIQVLFDG